MQGIFGSEEIVIIVFVIFAVKRLSLSAIISIIEKDNRLLNGIFGKPKRLYVTNVSSDLSSDAYFKP